MASSLFLVFSFLIHVAAFLVVAPGFELLAFVILHGQCYLLRKHFLKFLIWAISYSSPISSTISKSDFALSGAVLKNSLFCLIKMGHASMKAT